MSYRVDIHTDFHPELERQWRGFERSGAYHPFQTFDWNRTWWESRGSRLGILPCVAVVSGLAHEAPIAIFPFGIRRAAGARVLELLGGHQSDYLTPLFDVCAVDAATARVVWRAVERALPRQDAQVFDKVPQMLAGRENPWIGVWSCRPALAAYATTLPDSWTDFETRIPSRLRKDTNRQCRRLQEIDPVSLEVADSPDVYEELIEVMFQQKSDRYRTTGVRDAFADEDVREFYRRTRTALRDVEVQMSALRCGSRVVAAHWGLIYRGCYYWMIPSFDLGPLSRFSPGRLLQQQVIQWAIAQRLTLFDFTIGGEEYKQDWCDVTTTVCTATRAVTARGAVWLRQHRALAYVKSQPAVRAFVTGGVKLARDVIGRLRG